MTGIERLRELGNGISPFVEMVFVTLSNYCIRHNLHLAKGRDRFLRDNLLDIADQIAREITPQERHDEPADGRAADVSMSAYDLLPPDERESIAWVKEHGGTGFLDLHWGNMHRLVAEVARRLGYSPDCEDCEPVELLDALDRRLMPEGMEWLVDVWPKWSNGEYCKFGDWWKAEKYGEREPQQLRRLVFFTPEQLREWGQDEGENFGYEWDYMRPSDTTYRPDKVEPPAPKVLDADGVEVRKGDTVWHVETGEQCKVVEVDSRSVSVDFRVGGDCAKHTGSILPVNLTHRAPVLASDGRPLRKGETVWDVPGKRQFTVLEIGPDTMLGGYNVNTLGVDGMGLKGWSKPSDLTHERPDSWERLEEDAGKSYTSYWGCDGIPCYDCPAIVDGKKPDERYDAPNCSEAVKSDLVRRAKALAGGV